MGIRDGLRELAPTFYSPLLLGLCLCLMRRGFRVDLARQRLTSWCRVFVIPVFQRSRPVASVSEVAICTRMARRGGTSPGMRFYEQVEVVGAGLRFRVAEYTSLPDAVRAGRELAQILEVDLHRRAKEDRVIRYGDLGLSYETVLAWFRS